MREQLRFVRQHIPRTHTLTLHALNSRTCLHTTPTGRKGGEGFFRINWLTRRENSLEISAGGKGSGFMVHWADTKLPMMEIAFTAPVRQKTGGSEGDLSEGQEHALDTPLDPPREISTNCGTCQCKLGPDGQPVPPSYDSYAGWCEKDRLCSIETISDGDRAFTRSRATCESHYWQIAGPNGHFCAWRC